MPEDKNITRPNPEKERFISAGFAGAIEMMLYRYDTEVKRKQAKMILNDSLWRGFTFASCYKILSRMYKFGLQDVVVKNVSDLAGINNETMSPNKKMLLNGATGGAIAVTETCLFQPMEAIKVKLQTGATVSPWQILKSEGLNKLYRGTGVTLARNIPGSIAFFGGTSKALSAFFQIEDPKAANLWQNMVAASFGTIANVFFTSPQDVIKTRIQQANKTDIPKVSAVSMFAHIIKNEGPKALFTGATLRLRTTYPKFVLPSVLTNYLPTLWNKWKESEIAKKHEQSTLSPVRK